METVTLPNNSTRLVVVRRDWATATARITQIAAPLIQTPGVTYDIPLAQVVTAGGNISSITDLREFCRYSGEYQLNSVVTNYISTGSITPTKLANQTRSVFRGAGALKPDPVNPATRTNYTPTWWYSALYRKDLWQFDDGDWSGMWASFRVPEDIASATMTVYAHLTFYQDPIRYTFDRQQRWGWNCYRAQPAAAWALQSGTADITESYNGSDTGLYPAWFWHTSHRFSLGTFNATAGDIVHCCIYRDATADPPDTSQDVGFLHMVEFEYTADS